MRDGRAAARAERKLHDERPLPCRKLPGGCGGKAAKALALSLQRAPLQPRPSPKQHSPPPPVHFQVSDTPASCAGCASMLSSCNSSSSRRLWRLQAAATLQTATLESRHLALVGDSITRFQYLSLGHTLAQGEAPSFEYYRLRNGTRPGQWAGFFAASSSALTKGRALEYCDCSTTPLHEDRYLHVPRISARLSFFSWRADMRGQWRPSHEQRWPPDRDVNRRKANAAWRFTDARGLLSDIVLQLRPSPDWVVVSRGHWERLEWSTYTQLLEHGERLRRAHGTRFVWATTPMTQPPGLARTAGAPLSDAGYAHRAQEELVLAKRHGWGSLDLHGLTKSLPRAASWDGMHFREDVTLCLNQELLTAISMCCPPAPL